MRRLRTALAWLMFGALGFLFFFHAVARARFSPDLLAQIAALASFPLIGAIGFALTIRSDGWRIVEFTCDERSLRFRKTRGARETRDFSEITKVEEVPRRGGGRFGYAVGFRDGTEAFLPGLLPNADILADRLRRHGQPATPAPCGLGRILR
ncbi:MAG TPA: hypothetical protein VME43_19180 [Bryobacteraceae bacterium]|nr:hypothetical protein [Bryobacteraceae bacterium]